ncbi:MAG: SDR family NAD(P)-dependent oxidoreductase [Truepera sp.]|nr:SDR family NAD(P)-dependent oxidoreductase [Truepera sp.]
MDQELQERTAIITGASRGIGRATALALGGRGMRLGLLARSRERLEEVAAEVEVLGGRALVAECDLGDLSALEVTARRLIERLGSVDLLVNNAGVFHESAVAEQELDDWERVLRINLTAPMLLCQLILPLMIAAGGGRIVNIASSSAVQGYAGQAAYSASKHGLLGLARCLALEARPHNIHVHTLCPGGVDTDLIRGTEVGRRFEGQPLMVPQDIADLVLFCISQAGDVDMPEVVLRRFIPG